MRLIRPLFSLLLMAGAVVIGTQLDNLNNNDDPASSQPPAPDIYVVQQEDTPDAQPSIPPSTPLPTPTPSITLKPPPTLEPPTMTPMPSATPTITPTATIDVEVNIPGLNGAESPTPTSTPGCEPREDWHLTYTVQRDDALATIAEKYGTYVSDLASGNCLDDPNLIRIGQVLRVPGDAQPNQPLVECVPYEALTPANLSTIPENGMITFNWRGPLAPKNMLRIVRPDGSNVDLIIEFRQNEQVSVNEHLSQSGTYTWYVFPLNYNNGGVGCPNGGPWTFFRS